MTNSIRETPDLVAAVREAMEAGLGHRVSDEVAVKVALSASKYRADVSRESSAAERTAIVGWLRRSGYGRAAESIERGLHIIRLSEERPETPDHDVRGLVERLRNDIIATIDAAANEYACNDADYAMYERERETVRQAADALESLAAENARMREAAQQAADALYPFIGMIAHAFDEDGRYYWTRDPTEAESKAALDATYAVSASLQPQQGKEG